MTDPGTTVLVLILALTLMSTAMITLSRQHPELRPAAPAPTYRDRAGGSTDVIDRPPGPRSPQPPTRRSTTPPVPPDQGEPPLTRGPVVTAARPNGYFHGWCGPSMPQARLTVRGAALRGTGSTAVDAAVRAVGRNAAGAGWHARTGSLYLAVADDLGPRPGPAGAAQIAVLGALDLALRRDPDLDFTTFGGALFARVGIPTGCPGPPVGRTLNGSTALTVAEVRPTHDGAMIIVCGVGAAEAWLLDGHGWRAVHTERDTAADPAGAPPPGQLPPAPQPLTHRVHADPGSVLLLAGAGIAGALGTPVGTRLARRWRIMPTPLEFLMDLDLVEDRRADERAAVAVWIR